MALESPPSGNASPGGNGLLALVVAVLAASLLAGVAYAASIGLLRPSSPRTAMERQLAVLDPAANSQDPSGSTYAEYAAALIQAGQLSQAEDAIAAGFAVEPQSLVLRVEEARLLHARGESDAALDSLTQLLDLIQSVRQERASDFASRGITAPADRPETSIVTAAALLQAEIYSSMGLTNEAITAFSVALAEDPRMSDVLASRGHLYLELGQTKEAKNDFESALDFVPDLESALEGLKAIEGTEQ